jgi:hypothetical protein
MRYRTLRRLTSTGIALCAMALGLGVTEYALSLAPGATAANVNRVRARPGMTRAEVQALFRAPAVVDSGEVHYRGPDGVATVCFDRDGRSTNAFFRRGCRPTPHPLARLRQALGW